jgi:hypothetical protein
MHQGGGFEVASVLSSDGTVLDLGTPGAGRVQTLVPNRRNWIQFGDIWKTYRPVIYLESR